MTGISTTFIKPSSHETHKLLKKVSITYSRCKTKNWPIQNTSNLQKMPSILNVTCIGGNWYSNNDKSKGIFVV